MLSAQMASRRARAAGVALMILIVTVGEATAHHPAGSGSPDVSSGTGGGRANSSDGPSLPTPAPATIPSAPAPGYRLFDPHPTGGDVRASLLAWCQRGVLGQLQPLKDGQGVEFPDLHLARRHAPDQRRPDARSAFVHALVLL